MNSSRPYHHGNLRETLLEAALALIAEVGPAGFTLREVARRAGVSHNAPYRHFADKEALLAAVAAQGFRELTATMLESAAAETTAQGRLKQSGLAYIAFALRRPEHFSVMFDIPIAKVEYPECREAGQEAFSTLVRFVQASLEEQHLPLGNLEQSALMAWSLVHGIAKLATGGQLPFDSASGILQFAEAAVASHILRVI